MGNSLYLVLEYKPISRSMEGTCHVRKHETGGLGSESFYNRTNLH